MNDNGYPLTKEEIADVLLYKARFESINDQATEIHAAQIAKAEKAGRRRGKAGSSTFHSIFIHHRRLKTWQTKKQR